MKAWYWLLIVLACITLALFTTDFPRTKARDAQLPPELEGEPDVYMERATITQYAESGHYRYKLFSENIRYFEKQQLTRLTEPRLAIYRRSDPETQTNTTQAPWLIESAHGYIRQRKDTNREVVFLRENVRLKHTPSTGPAMTLRTESLYVYPHRQFAETDQPVMIDSTVGRTKAAGFEGDLNTGLLTMSSSVEQRVHTIVLPSQIKRGS